MKRSLYENGHYHTLDLTKILERANLYAQQLGPRATDTFWKINGANAQLMRTHRL